MKPVLFRRATESEKAGYDGLYGLHGFCLVARYMGGHFVCPVERLERIESFDPKYEVVAPPGFVFCGESTSTLLAFDMSDLRERIECNLIVSGEPF